MPNGRFCDSPALHGRPYCHFHLDFLARRLRAAKQQRQGKGQAPELALAGLELPPLEDANSVQLAIMQVLEAALRGRIDHKLCGLLLYGLQTASGNVKNVNFHPEVEEFDPEVCRRYDGLEEDYDIVGEEEGLRCAGLEEEEEEEEDQRTAAAATGDHETGEEGPAAPPTYEELKWRVAQLERNSIGRPKVMQRAAGRQLLTSARKLPSRAEVPASEKKKAVEG